MWFESLTGFEEESPEQVRENLELQGRTLTSLMNGREMVHGRLETPSLSELREALLEPAPGGSRLSVREEIGDAQQLHQQQENQGALFQVASQFNLLEMMSQHVTPEKGVGIYGNDPTQGPACAVAAGAGTIFRNYFASVNGEIGQSSHRQIDCLADLGEMLGNSQGEHWKMENGYALATSSGLAHITRRLSASDDAERDRLRGAIRIGMQWDTEVTLGNVGHLVSQAYCSGLPVRYSEHSNDRWEPFARLVLEAAYEATLACAVINQKKTGNGSVFLTLLGGGVFGNESGWIIDAMRRALDLFAEHPLDVCIVSHENSNPVVQDLCASWVVPR